MENHFEANTEPSEPRSGIASTSYGKPDGEHHVSGGATSESPVARNLHESTLIQSPPIQVMDRVIEGLDPYRVPSSVFDRSKSTNPASWSIASNESLFSIQIGNTSFSREQFLNFKSGEFFEDELLSTSPAASPPYPGKAGVEFDKLSDYTVKDKTRPSAEEPTGEKPEHFWNSPCPSRLSVETGASVHSFAFPMRKMHDYHATVGTVA
ncbi:uncharacterized protein LOC120156475 [Hibiscus syriacus]|uniref:uncharacterized protein LOC120156475 n=1 Tax=Hibiscus syriacus TaxID=106335 RepID=UPI0019224ECE|nr:uncharacterized protein LOC120156475 [Hibiscus syriacus]